VPIPGREPNSPALGKPAEIQQLPDLVTLCHPQALSAQSITNGVVVALLLCASQEPAQMTLRIEKVSDGRVVILHLSGRLQAVHLEELKAHMEGIAQRLARKSHKE
jgi:hypothetical protein